MSGEPDFVQLYAKSLGHVIRPRTMLVEGTSDVDIFALAARLEMNHSGVQLLDDEFTLIAAGEGDRGGVNGVLREFIGLRGMARTLLLPGGKPKYRFTALLDNDDAGRKGVKVLRGVDTSVIEFRDVFLLHPVMPIPGMLDAATVQSAFAKSNLDAKGIDWELEDLIDDGLFRDFVHENPGAVRNTLKSGGFVHRELTRDGKAQLLRHVKQYAVLADMQKVISTLRTLRYLAGASKK
jgi:hypothetical protein